MANSKTAAFIFLGIGAGFAYGAVTGRSPLLLIRGVIKGQKPSAVPAQYTISQSPATVSSGSVTPVGGNPESATQEASNQALGRLLAVRYGWATGQEWTALNNIVMDESGWNADAVNPSSGAAGIAQNIQGWGPDYEEGNASQQISWMLAYIQQRYGDPVKAWAFHLANGYY